MPIFTGRASRSFEMTGKVITGSQQISKVELLPPPNTSTPTHTAEHCYSAAGWFGVVLPVNVATYAHMYLSCPRPPVAVIRMSTTGATSSRRTTLKPSMLQGRGRL